MNEIKLVKSICLRNEVIHAINEARVNTTFSKFVGDILEEWYAGRNRAVDELDSSCT